MTLVLGCKWQDFPKVSLKNMGLQKKHGESLRAKGALHAEVEKRLLGNVVLEEWQEGEEDVEAAKA